MNYNNIVKYLFELGHLKKIKHEGWRLLGIANPESIADHSLRAAQIGFVLAKLEKFENPYLVTTMLVFHDVGEIRIGDIHLIAKKYLKINEIDAVRDQLVDLKIFKNDILKMWSEVEKQNTIAGIIAKDADLLEQALTAKEFYDNGLLDANKWLKNISKSLKTKSAKGILKCIEKKSSSNWWQELNHL